MVGDNNIVLHCYSVEEEIPGKALIFVHMFGGPFVSSDFFNRINRKRLIYPKRERDPQSVAHGLNALCCAGHQQQTSSRSRSREQSLSAISGSKTCKYLMSSAFTRCICACRVHNFISPTGNIGRSLALN